MTAIAFLIATVPPLSSFCPSDQHQDADDDQYEWPPLAQKRTKLRNPAKIREKKKRANNDEDHSAAARPSPHMFPSAMR
jgi:hypothetical protein